MASGTIGIGPESIFHHADHPTVTPELSALLVEPSGRQKLRLGAGWLIRILQCNTLMVADNTNKYFGRRVNHQHNDSTIVRISSQYFARVIVQFSRYLPHICWHHESSAVILSILILSLNVTIRTAVKSRKGS
jgi:hypothetical protein